MTTNPEHEAEASLDGMFKFLAAQETEEEADIEARASSQTGESDLRLWETTPYSEVRFSLFVMHVD